ncbi:MULTISPECIES: hypothetical protein [Streptomyces]|uniref:hypothetical protein n=1 Tax=Streptomyces TaxID=1883 RepID=UPI0016746434|nr:MULTISPECIES: hypothetical protein [Streptomyces]MBK3524854.1 hypothetical protein [Streptomyces sp. MBT70]GGR70907.1 hypothetical protein GCM10010236_26450 [Streptomyces eurythermus]
MSYPALFTTPGMRNFAEEVDAERQRQLAKWGDQRHPILRGPSNQHLFEQLAQAMRETNTDPDQICWMTILLEEAYEAGAERDMAKLRAEVIQIAAVCQAIVADLDSRSPAARRDGAVS